jgi:hypothetical protein
MHVVSFDVGIKNLAYAVARVCAQSGAQRVVEVERWGTACLCVTSARSTSWNATR